MLRSLRNIGTAEIVLHEQAGVTRPLHLLKNRVSGGTKPTILFRTMTTQDCPLPEVAEALSPYIKSREDVTKIRQGLQNYLQSQLQTQGVSSSSLNVAASYGSELDSPPPRLTGVRKAYWRALQAHSAAQAKYDALKTELDQLKHNKTAHSGNEGVRNANSIDESYIALLRQREKYRKLKVIDRALSEINSTDSETPTNNLDDIVKKKIGDLPTPPSTQPSFSRSPEVESKVMELKKAVVSTKRRAEQQGNSSTTNSANGTNDATPQAEIAGLQSALQELTSWMEDKLTLIASAEMEAQSAGDGQTPNGTSAKSPISTEDIEALYEQYLDARQRLIHTVNDSPAADADASAAGFDFEHSRSKSVDPSKSAPKSSAESVLPYIPSLVAAKQEEQSLFQQTTYVRRQLSAAEEQTASLIRRLADESHLVQPGASHGKDWVVASKNAGAATEEFIRQRLAVGETSVGSAEETLEAIESWPESLNRVVD